MSNEIYINCPHCELLIQIFSNEINCAIFRHGCFKDTYIQIPSHETEEICTKLYLNNKIFGCGKPFKLTQKNNNYIAEKCDYI